MTVQSGRYTAATAATAAEGWRLARLTPPSRLFGANGMRTGKDGRIYVVSVGGSNISAIDPDTGAIDVVSPMGGGIVGPDDLVFDDDGNIYVTEITEGRVTMLAPNGTTKVIYGDMPVANPITMHENRLIAGECHFGGRVMELDRNGGAPRTILADAPMPNAFSVGPDGKLYMPMMGTNEIWRIGLDGGSHEVVAGDLGVPDSVKFDAQGFIVSTQVGSGQVLRIDPRDGSRQVLANIMPGLDNCTFVGDRLFVSSIPGGIFEIDKGGGGYKPLVPHGLQWPLGLALDESGALFVADGGLCYMLRPGGKPDLAGMFFTPGYPGYVRGVAHAGPGEWIVTTGTGDVARYWPAEGRNEFLASGLGWLMGVAIAPGGVVVCAGWDSGRLHGAENGEVSELGAGLDKPMGVAIGTDGTIYVAESAAGRIVKSVGGRFETVLDGLEEPQGLAFADGQLFIVDAGAKELIVCDPSGGNRHTLASALPVGAPAGVIPKFLGPIGALSGPLINFADVTVAADGTIYLSGDAEGSVLALSRA